MLLDQRGDSLAWSMQTPCGVLRSCAAIVGSLCVGALFEQDFENFKVFAVIDPRCRGFEISQFPKKIDGKLFVGLRFGVFRVGLGEVVLVVTCRR